MWTSELTTNTATAAARVGSQRLDMEIIRTSSRSLAGGTPAPEPMPRFFATACLRFWFGGGSVASGRGLGGLERARWRYAGPTVPAGLDSGCATIAAPARLHRLSHDCRRESHMTRYLRLFHAVT